MKKWLAWCHYFASPTPGFLCSSIKQRYWWGYELPPIRAAQLHVFQKSHFVDWYKNWKQLNKITENNFLQCTFTDSEFHAMFCWLILQNIPFYSIGNHQTRMVTDYSSVFQLFCFQLFLIRFFGVIEYLFKFEKKLKQ